MFKDKPEFESVRDYIAAWKASKLYVTDVTFIRAQSDEFHTWILARGGSLYRPADLPQVGDNTFATVTLEPQYWPELLELPYVLEVFLARGQVPAWVTDGTFPNVNAQTGTN